MSTVSQIKRLIQRHDDGEIGDHETVDLMKRLFEQYQGETRDRDFMVFEKALESHGHQADLISRIKHNGILHKAHLYTDLGIGMFALIGLAALLFGFEEVIETFFEIDLWFHIVVIAMTFGMIIAERVLHRHRHSGVIH